MIVTLVGTFLTICIGLYAVAWLIETATGGWLSAVEASGGPPPDFVAWVGLCYSSIIRFVPFGLSAWVFVRLGRRSGLRWWSVAACRVIATIAIFFSFIVTPQTAQSKGLILFGFDWRIGFNQILQATVPLALGLWMLWRSSASRPKMLAA